MWSTSSTKNKPRMVKIFNFRSPTQEHEEDDVVLYSKVSTEAENFEKGPNLRSWKNPSSDTLDGLQARQSLSEENLDDDDEERVIQRPKNHMGVEIMPLILEEDEEEDDTILEFAQKRLSRV